MSITGDMVIDYEMASTDEFLEYYGWLSELSVLEEMAMEEEDS